jgi:hypothetical protein
LEVIYHGGWEKKEGGCAVLKFLKNSPAEMNLDTWVDMF